ncbi:MAG: hypothetical protein HUU55_16905 [Myxococcales bacterium]|nr:hypothetical protein [Myxococcales bacterium]
MSKRSHSRRLLTSDDVEATLADGYLRLVHECTSVTISPTYPIPSMKEAPSITGIVGDKNRGDTAVIAVVSGEYLRYLLGRKHGFSVTEKYLDGLRKTFHSIGQQTLLVWVFSPFAETDAVLVDKLASRTGLDIQLFGPSQLEKILLEMEPRIPAAFCPTSNWFIAVWSVIGKILSKKYNPDS